VGSVPIRPRKASVRACLFFILAFAGPGRVPYAQTPIIRSLTPSDPVFAQLAADVEQARRLLADRTVAPAALIGSLAVYEYLPTAEDSLMGIAARCALPYETIATANRLPAGGRLHTGRTLLLPSIPGLFVPERLENDMERIVDAARQEGETSVSVVVRAEGRPIRFRFYPGSEFTPTERAFFLNVAFRLPLPQARVTSSFGMRRNPVTGTFKKHEGVDLAAPEGTEVYAARDGIVAEIGDDPVYGIYVVVEHDGAWRSIYGHLSAVTTDLRNRVRSGTIIGRVGSTGQSTGPHLHFELRRNGEARDPAALLPRGIGR